MAVSIEEALETLYTSGMLDRIRPNMGKQYTSLGISVENDGDETVLVLVIKDQLF